MDGTNLDTYKVKCYKMFWSTLDELRQNHWLYLLVVEYWIKILISQLC